MHESNRIIRILSEIIFFGLCGFVSKAPYKSHARVQLKTHILCNASIG